MSEKQKLLELLPAMSVHGESANARQVEILASELMAARAELSRLEDLVSEIDAEIIRKVLDE